MIRVLFFASLRERLGLDQLELPADDTACVSDLRQVLRERGEDWADLLDGEWALVAVNQTMARDQTPVSDGDEVAFFPPVTGG
ncbi:molybdopterin synthase subunit MoaD [Halospina denitrificans]|uniref:Molybdopterin synthase sulfur carrier subunit n=1 Tax=Halospina denitrificans TaxID=332522 RepID=A0A4R7K2Y3_9GAMM|nr:molybdopterin converting factor subunit 1 [Halospina denitrificans]TDT44313.1 molybdopterin synthase subunit MoaD [Halospina denitrificans]